MRGIRWAIERERRQDNHSHSISDKDVAKYGIDEHQSERFSRLQFSISFESLLGNFFRHDDIGEIFSV